jgi:hypothetical protein
MNTYHVGYDDSGTIVCVTSGAVSGGSATGWLEVEADEAPRSHGFRVVDGAVVPFEVVGPPRPLPTAREVPAREDFLEALYQEFLGNDAPMNALRARRNVSAQSTLKGPA